MPFVPVPNTLSVELRYVFSNQQVENTLYFEYGAAPDVAEAETLAEVIHSWWLDEMRPLQVSQLALREIYIADLSNATSFSFTRVSSPTEPGTRSGPAMPNNIALCISFKTNQRGRSFRGRNYVMGMNEGDVVDNNFDPGYVTSVQAAYVALNAAVTPLNADWVIVSRFSGGNPRSTGVTTPVSTVGVTDGIVDSQRRRLPGRGR